MNGGYCLDTGVVVDLAVLTFERNLGDTELRPDERSILSFLSDRQIRHAFERFLSVRPRLRTLMSVTSEAHGVLRRKYRVSYGREAFWRHVQDLYSYYSIEETCWPIGRADPRHVPSVGLVDDLLVSFCREHACILLTSDYRTLYGHAHAKQVRVYGPWDLLSEFAS